MNASASNHPNAALYCQIMEQIKWRIDGVFFTLNSIKRGDYPLRNLQAAEFCLLQLRMICELIALGCIAVHTDISQSRALQKEWNADQIANRLQNLKPSFFPIPGTDTTRPDGVIVISQTNIRALTVQELKKKYNFFGSLLHAGNFESLKNPDYKHYNFMILEDFMHSVARLLEFHIYYLNDGKTLIRVVLSDNNGQVCWNELDRIDEATAATFMAQRGTPP